MKYPKSWEGFSKIRIGSFKEGNSTEDEHRKFCLRRPASSTHI